MSQLRDETKLLSWVNTIALNYGRKRVRARKLQETLGPTHEPRVKPVDAVIDLKRILSRCRAADREILEAQLEGLTPMELAEEHGISHSATRLRSFRARRAARAVCDPPCLL